MAEEFNIILEHIKIIRSDVSKIKEEQRLMRDEMRADRRIVSGILASSNNQDDIIASLRERIRTLEARWDISDDPH